MTIELQILTASVMWGFVQLVLAAQSANVQYGLKWGAGPRDHEMPPLMAVPGRLNRNFRNYLETFPFFAAAVLIAQAAEVHNPLTKWGAISYLGARIAYSALYVSGVPFVRSLAWNVAALAILAIALAPFV